MQTKRSTVTVGQTRDHTKIFLRDKLFDWAFGDNEDDPNEALLQASDEFESQK